MAVQMHVFKNERIILKFQCSELRGSEHERWPAPRARQRLLQSSKKLCSACGGEHSAETELRACAGHCHIEDLQEPR
jgi:hypothetical protein